MHISQPRSSLVVGLAALVLGALGASITAMGCGGGSPGGTTCESGTCPPTNPCAATPCQNSGTCAANGSDYTCACAPGFTGKNCEVDVDDCASSPCVNGDCTDGVNQYTCACAPGFEGKNCEVDVDDCATNPCLNGGTCADGVNSHTCDCPAGFSGANCETCVPTTCEAQGATCGDIPDGCGSMLTCGAACIVCPCAGKQSWKDALAGTLVTTGPCLNYSFPAPCGSVPDSSWAFSLNGATLTRIMGGTENGMFGTQHFCGVQVHENNPNSCGGQGLDITDIVDPAEAAACKADVLKWAEAQGGVCN